jgi:kumamolisin
MKRITPILAVLISSLLISQPVFASALQTQTYSSLASSSIVPLLSHSDVTTVGDIDGSKNLDITISLKLRNKEVLKQKIDLAHSKKISGKIVSDQDMVTSYLPVANSQSKVINFLKSKGLQITRTSGNRMSIKVQGTAKAIEDAFNVKINNYTENGKQFFANSNEPQLPSTIASEIESIDGLNNLQLKPSYSMSSLTPSTIKKQYDITPLDTANINGKGVKLAVATYCDFDLNDEAHFLETYGINVAAPVTTIHVDGTPEIDSSSATETMLDIESALSTAPGAELLIYDGATSSSNTGIDVFSKIVDDGEADVVSYSWGANESYLSSSNVNAMNSLFVAGSAKGMTFMAATGDSGSSDIIYPATDPYVTAVGGTTLNIDRSSGEFVSEVGWRGSGGGVSSLFAKPSWQQGVANSPSYGRTVPDVSLDADPNTGYPVYVGGVWYNMGGTSGSTPHWAGIIALVDQSRANNGLGPLGLANPALYSSKVRAAYKDITSGSNGLYSCYQGYDMVTGWGSVDVAKLVNILGTYTEDTVVAPNIPVTGVSLNKTSSSIDVGASDNLSAVVTPENATNKDVIWNSSNTSVADVDNTGNVVGISAGTAVITVQTADGRQTATCEVTVSPPNIPVTGVSLNKTSSSIDVGASDNLSAVVTPENATNKDVIWNSSNTSVADVDNTGNVVGISAGTAVITVTTIDGSKSAICTVTVMAAIGVTTDRLSGTDRIGTAIKVADQFVSPATAILAPAANANLVDALAAAPLAGKTSPILLTDNNTLSAATKAELIKLKVTKVYVVGAISQAVFNEVKAMPDVTVAIQLRGADRITTAALISSKLTNIAGSFVVGYGALPDALSVASFAAAHNYSIIVANPDGSLPVSEAAYKGATVYIVGGPKLVADIEGATRLAGADRYATNKVVLETLSYSYSKVYVANGTQAHLVDSLVASSLAASDSAPIILTDTTTYGDATVAYIGAKLANNGIVVALGGSTVVLDTTLTKVTNASS